ncbi:hypothetical protein P775_18050 [Puniceibacterium antarcticum]|uniref:TNase-like domain-containing protein n=1 Tax=Puniceibacterium antarcticum TaxID=1206336 RepID=A0A2G8RAB1_9RHOB|nr:hypothetical protein P775_18050 [Puniceibacterium antarcticum]
MASSVLAAPNGILRVIDGDTFDVGKVRVRLHAVDAPEQAQTCGTPAWACGAWVTQEVRKRYQGQWAICEATDTDRYGRVVARCSVNGQDVGAALVSDGLAFAYRQYGWDYDLTEKAAAVAGVGLHSEQMQLPSEYRKAQRPAPKKPQQPEVQGCAIKGNVSRDGTRIYHVPGQAFYDKTRINEGAGEHWFCSEAEAVKAGWRKAQR